MREKPGIRRPQTEHLKRLHASFFVSAAVLLPVFDCGTVEVLFFVSAVGMLLVFVCVVVGALFLVPADGDAAGSVFPFA